VPFWEDRLEPETREDCLEPETPVRCEREALPAGARVREAQSALLAAQGPWRSSTLERACQKLASRKLGAGINLRGKQSRASPPGTPRPSRGRRARRSMEAAATVCARCPGATKNRCQKAAGKESGSGAVCSLAEGSG
jgi:hypothetical protein